ncbi:MAG: divergent polysaccharide deacetylase family protein [Candidatus Omnitrophica bacterium]|nr:divergent polysaccharide deacetylase family protein [Candidatus Omnitrophota bacterium]
MFPLNNTNIFNKNGKTSRPSLGVFVLLVIIAVQAYFLVRAYLPAGKTASVNRQKLTVAVPSKSIPKVLPPVSRKSALPSPPPTTAGQIVLIIDDSGYNSRDCSSLAAIDVPVTISILPQLAHSREIAECAHAQGKEVMLHLPLEPHVFREEYPANYFIRTAMTSTKIINRFTEALKSVPHVVGVNNHEGSKATEDSRVMYILFKEFIKKKVFFVDSRVTSKSICKNLADKLNLPFASRDVFLDNINKREEIEKQFEELAKKSTDHGVAVAIGHARPLSWVVMTEQIKKLTAQGYEFITVQQLISQDQ